MYFIYTLVLSLGLMVTLPYYLVRFRKYLPTLRDRLGFLKVPNLRGSIWVHAVSVGEVRAVEKLLEGLREQFPGKTIVVSTSTVAGQQLARERRDIIDHAFYFPIDLPWCIRRVIDRIDPEMVIIAETEIWPNFLRACRTRGIRVVMINGRISDRSFPRYRLGKRWLRRVFEDYSIIGMQSEADRDRIQAIGADPRKVTVFGNLKYDTMPTTRMLDPTLAGFLETWQPLWIAASTMSGEEELILDAFAQLRRACPELKLALAPRHPDRFDAVAELIKQKSFRLVRRTELRAGSADVLLLDTIGELAAVFQYASVVFIGGSLVPTGGHNVLEPARHAKPIVFGPHMQNFREIERLFLEADAGIQLQNASQLAPAITKLLSNSARAAELGTNAKLLVERNSGATERVLKILKPLEAVR